MFNIAAIDVGSNAMRMVIGAIGKVLQVRPIKNIRLPVRLGHDVFSSGHLEEKTIEQTEDAFRHFRQIGEMLNVQYLRAIATSAAREAANSSVLLERVFQTTGIAIEIISGEEEAYLIHSAVAHALNLKNKHSLLIDIGGGSIEVTISTDWGILSTDSYNIGTVRLLEKTNGKDKSKHVFESLVREYAEATRERIEQDLPEENVQICVGTGGNVEAIGRLREKLFKAESDRCISLEELERLIEILDHLTYEERIRKLKLRPDRADVILPASVVLHEIAKATAVKQIAIPNVGLKDGLLLEMAQDLARSINLVRRKYILQE
jgi:exopolyphosphatase/guanosine-5'-triphosphate,3'-diphosphate pyrophosphatase